MDHSNFLSSWNRALKTTGLTCTSLFPEQSVDLGSMDRTYRGYFTLGSVDEHPFSPFFVTVELSWRWEALFSARFITTEEDLLMQIYGEHGLHEDTDTPMMRVDFSFHATLPIDRYALVPPPEAWRKWAIAVSEQIPPSFAREFDHETTEDEFSWCGEPVIETICSSSGQVYLSSIRLAASMGIALPRQWDNPDRPIEDDPFDQLNELFTWISKNTQVWGKSLKVLY